MKRIILHAAAALALIASISISCKKDDPEVEKPQPGGNDTPSNAFNPAKDKVSITEEFRGTWVATVYSLDWPSGSGMAAQKSAMDQLFTQIKNAGMNAVVFQVVSMSDAMYKSSILPWAKQLSGSAQGVDPGWDPLEYAVESAHAKGLELHAWINPLRIGSASALCSTHPAVLHPEMRQSYKSSLYWNPGRPDVIQYLGDLATEIVSKYDVDGLHIDDYFYPSGLKSSAQEWDDSAEYAAYGQDMTLDNWRYSNINALVKKLYDSVKAVNPEVMFGVSPQGRIGNTKGLYADPEQWIKGGYVDYIAPQIYWWHGHSTADFPTVAKTWVDIAGNVKIMPGIAAYRYQEANTGFSTMTEYYNQIAVCRSYGQMCGNFWYRAKQYINNTDFANYLTANIYTAPCIAPRIIRSSPAKNLDAPVPVSDGSKISWPAVSGAKRYVVYKLDKTSTGSWKATMVQNSTLTSCRGVKSGQNYGVIAMYGRCRSSIGAVCVE